MSCSGNQCVPENKNKPSWLWGPEARSQFHGATLRRKTPHDLRGPSGRTRSWTLGLPGRGRIAPVCAPVPLPLPSVCAPTLPPPLS